MTRHLTLAEASRRIRPADRGAMLRARSRQSTLTKPEGSLGRLEDISIRLAGMFGTERPSIRGKTVIVAAGDHGVTAQGVTGYPQAVTAQMAHNFLSGGAAVSVMANLLGVRQIVVDAGIAGPALPRHPDLRSVRVGRGTGDMSLGPAMSRDQGIRCVEAGMALAVEAAAREGSHLIATGDMGIGNTTSSSAVTAAITGRPPEETTGAGTGRTPEELLHKTDVVRRALRVNGPDPSDPLDVLAKVGGFEIGVLAGVILGGAVMRCAVLLDGFISGASALIAQGLCGAARDYMIASHRSAEQGHEAVLSHLDLKPLLEFNMRLGEGTGAVLAIPIVEAAAACLARMATFEQAGVSNLPDGPQS
ncbi:MAG: nicotinate-nucleotide--dimethylbenzimidazole phosphoribosyltransferase [bacterium]|nr:nicotinate-nucleotide--dimethylbenzimidazole phosphoribosyltransferase [bacterium]MDE0600702.1 nicotinate-nucleotide--dimethylbenzimidazole phosphoribosyltransferase [bacterium]